MVGEGFAVVLDGATSVAGDRSHDPGWYAGRLADVLGRSLPGKQAIADVVAAAIEEVRDAEGLVAASSPTCTVSIARWSQEIVEVYSLCDSLVVVLGRDGNEAVCTDDDLGKALGLKRAAYRERLAAGFGYDEGHRQLLVELQEEQARWRNRPGGYWVAGTDPEAAYHAVTSTVVRDDVMGLVLATDGVDVERHPIARTWRDIYDQAMRSGPAQVLHDLHAAEKGDPDGRRWARSKRHDDKTLVVVPLA